MLHKVQRVLSLTRLNQKILTMAIPVFFGMLSYTAIMIADTAMVGKLGATSQAAAGFGGIVYFTILSFLMGGSMAVQIVVARRVGEKNDLGVGITLTNSLYLSSVIGIILSLAGYYYGHSMMGLLGDDREVIFLSGEYLSYRFLGTVFFFMGFALRGFFDGIGIMEAGMISSITAAVTNIFFNWLLIYGNWGFPEWGVKGAAIASALAGIPSLVVVLLFFLRKDVKKYFNKKVWVPSIQIIQELGVVGFAPAVEGTLTNLSFVGFMKISGMISTISLAASNVVLACLSLSFMPGFAFGISATTILGQAMGAGKVRLAYQGTMRSATFSAIMMGSMGLVFILFGKFLLTFFTSESLVVTEAYPALVVVAFIQVGDAYHMVVGSALRSAGLMYWVLIAYVLVSFGIMLPLAYLFGIVLKGGTIGIWFSFFIWILILAILFIQKFRKKEWVNIRI
ncbi:MATE family efflux transporter [Leptospira ilyithenensis]|uniref:Multidrug-efflux transporter n=2 Tax=Leptospira ilyithenensis TaxID=2484901 RepID=A0A4R9LSC9_9LEPT|nr:MATE family efflux transporter [Leptospira ilyithenensis]